jgi:general secretion pathway protein C
MPAKSRAPFESVYVYLLLALIGYMIADLGILSVRDKMIITTPPPAKQRRMRIAGPPPDRNYYGVIANRNIFNSDGLIPDPMGAKEGGQDADPVPSALPLNLVGTLVHANPLRSVASIQLKSKNEVDAFRVNEEIESMARVTGIERNKVVFRNLENQRLEYIEIKTESRLSFGMSGPPKAAGEIMQASETEFEIKRTEIDRLTSNLGDLLQQARAIPNMRNGRLDGFIIADIQKGSIFEKLGIKQNDVIKSVNGETIDSPAKAMELYQALRSNSSQVNLQLERDGRTENFTYTIK